MRKKNNRQYPRVEALEERVLFAGHGHKAIFDLASLSDYDDVGSSWDYAINYSVASNLTATSNGQGNETVSVVPDGPTDNQLQIASDSGENVTFNVLSGSGGLGIGEVQFSPIGSGTPDEFDIFGGTADFLPSSAVQGKTYKDTKTLLSNLNDSGTILGNLMGVLKGTCKTTAKAVGTKAVSVPAGTFSTAVESDFTIELKGKIKQMSGNKSYYSSFKATLASTLWAADGTGVVQSQDAISVTIKVPHEQPGILLVNTMATLTDAEPA